MAVLKDLFPDLEPRPPLVDPNELSTVVRYVATAARENAEVTGDEDTQFWSAVALSGLEMLNDNKPAALQGIRDACAVPSATLFSLQSLEDRLVLLEKLSFKTEIVSEAQRIVEQTLNSKRRTNNWAKVVVFYGYPIDTSGQSPARFPASSVSAVQNKIEETLEKWKIGEGDLAICAGATEGDVLFSEKCLERGAHLRLLMMEATPCQLAEAVRNSSSSQWTTRAYALVEHAKTEIWYHQSELGDPVEPSYLQGRNNRWILNTARMEAEKATEEGRLYGLIVWDSSLRVSDPVDPSFFIAEIRRCNPYRGGVVVINPSEITTETPPHTLPLSPEKVDCE